MKKLLLALALFLIPAAASAQCNGIFNSGTICGVAASESPRPPHQITGSSVTGPGTTVIGDIAIWADTHGSQLSDLAPGALTKVDDTNVTLTLGGSPTNALLRAASITLGWQSTLAVTRGGTGLASGTSGGIPYFSTTTTIASSAAISGLVFGNGAGAAPTVYAGTSCTNQFPRSLNASGVATCATVSLTTDVTGTLPIANGGTNAITAAAALVNLFPVATRAGDVVYWNGSAWVTLAGNNSGTQFLQENSSGVPSWATVAGTGTVTLATIVGAGLTVNSGTCAITTTGTCTLTTTAASKSDQQTGTSTTTVVTPAQAAASDSAAKVWSNFVGAGCSGTCTQNASYNTGTVTRSSTGQYVINFTTAFASANYTCSVTTNATGGTALFGFINAQATGSMSITTINSSFAVADPVNTQVICFGRQ